MRHALSPLRMLPHVVDASPLVVGARAQPGLGSCYSPGDVWAQDQHPCDLHSVVSLCCPTGWTCFSNKLCIVTDPVAAAVDIGTTSRGTCTNPDWDQEICGDFCLGDENGAMTACGNSTWCCSSDLASGHCDCDSGEGTFTVEAGKALALVGFAHNHFTVTTGAAVPTSTGPIVQPSRHTKSSAASSAAASSSAASSSAATTASSRPASANAAAASATAASSQGQLTSPPLAKILGPIFGVLAFLLLLALLWFLWRRRARRREESRSPSPDTFSKPPIEPTPVVPMPASMASENAHPRPEPRFANRTHVSPVPRPLQMAANPTSRPPNRSSGYTPMFAVPKLSPTPKQDSMGPGSQGQQIRRSVSPALAPGVNPSEVTSASDRRQSIPRKPVPGGKLAGPGE